MHNLVPLLWVSFKNFFLINFHPQFPQWLCNFYHLSLDSSSTLFSLFLTGYQKNFFLINKYYIRAQFATKYLCKLEQVFFSYTIIPDLFTKTSVVVYCKHENFPRTTDNASLLAHCHHPQCRNEKIELQKVLVLRW